MKSAVVVECVRTPVGRAHPEKGVFRNVRSDDLAVYAIEGLLERVEVLESDLRDQLADGSVAAAFLGGAIPTAAITQVCSARGIRFLPYDEQAMASVAGEYVFFDRATIPAGTYRGQDVDYLGLDVGSMHLIAAEALEQQVRDRLAEVGLDPGGLVVVGLAGDLVHGGGAVDSGLARAEQVQIGTIEEQNAGHCPSLSANS